VQSFLKKNEKNKQKKKEISLLEYFSKNRIQNRK